MHHIHCASQQRHMHEDRRKLEAAAAACCVLPSHMCQVLLQPAGAVSGPLLAVHCGDDSFTCVVQASNRVSGDAWLWNVDFVDVQSVAVAWIVHCRVLA
jgi:hypothetical protein